MGEDEGREDRLPQAGHDRVAFGAQMFAQRHTGRVAAERARELNVGGEREHEQDEGGPERGRSRQHRPSEREEQHERRRNQAAPEVVEDLPARNHRQRIGDGPAGGVRNGAPQPARDLPVPAHPPVLPRGIGEVVAGIVVHQVRIGDEAGARIEAFEEIMTQQRVFRHAPGERRLERVHVVDALADVAALVKHVLIEVGHGRRVGIDADVPREHAAKTSSGWR